MTKAKETSESHLDREDCSRSYKRGGYINVQMLFTQVAGQGEDKNTKLARICRVE